MLHIGSSLRIVAAALLIAAAPSTAAAQGVITLKGGMSWAGLVGEGENDEGSLQELFGGIAMAFPISNNMAIQGELLFMRKGAKLFQQVDPRPRIVTDTLTDMTDTIPAMGPRPAAGLRMNYVEIPVLFRFALPRPPILPSVYIGPFIAFNQDCDLIPGGTDTDSEPVDCDDASATQHFDPASPDLGVVIGAALDLLIGSTSSVSIEGRYNVGAFSIEDGDDPADITHAVWAVLVGVTFPVAF